MLLYTPPLISCRQPRADRRQGTGIDEQSAPHAPTRHRNPRIIDAVVILRLKFRPDARRHECDTERERDAAPMRASPPPHFTAVNDNAAALWRLRKPLLVTHMISSRPLNGSLPKPPYTAIFTFIIFPPTNFSIASHGLSTKSSRCRRISIYVMNVVDTIIISATGVDDAGRP